MSGTGDTAPAGTSLKLTAVLLVAVWALSEARLFLPTEGIRMAGAAAMAVFLVPAILRGRRTTQALALFLLGTALTLAYGYDAWASVWGGLERAILLVALLPTLSLLRVAIQKDLRLNAYRRRVEAVGPSQRPMWILGGSYVTASLLSVGALSVFAALLRPDAPEETRLRDAYAGVCGASLAILWSPFFFALAFVTEYVPDISLTALIATGLALSLVGLAVAFRVSGAGEDMGGAAEAVGALRAFVLPIAVVTLALVTVRAVSGLSTIESMLVVMPVLCLLLLLMPPRIGPGPVVAQMWTRLYRIQDEAAIVGSATVFGTVLSAVPWMEEAAFTSLLGGMPAPLVVCGCITFMIGAGMIGLLPLVTGTIVLVVLTTLPNTLSDLAIGLTVLAGWSLASMASMSSMMVLVAAGQYELRPEQLVFGRNLLFLAIFVPLAALAIVAVDAFT